MPSLKRLWNEGRDKGLHILHIESQGHTEQEVQAFCDKNGVNFPNVVGRSGFSQYQGDNGLPYAFVIGVEGKVLFQGRGNYDAVIHEELKKVRYPGLGKLTVAKPLHKAASYFGRKQYGKAMSEAEKAQARAEADEDGDRAVIEDAKYIHARVLHRGKQIKAAVEKAKKEREYGIAVQTLKEMSVWFKGTPLGDEAAAARKELTKNPEVKEELKALSVYEGLLAKLEKVRDPAQKSQALEAFAKKYDGFKAAEKAREKARSF